ncbi:MAG: hypothetical protein DI598_14995 [Pseudopedobacter saltans]|uniref:Uncharacterized protein n=1 Tax=Pseudopedobacter saltans TaxID=151895 RepID=A0A2W5ENB2_9SPHI|nr:MAG: hypothetical protein DI598_14995 [Pseudopedobacter saltans]
MNLLTERFFIRVVPVILFLIGLFSNGFAQKKVEKLKSDADVVKFAKSYFHDFDDTDHWKYFKLVTGDEWKGIYNIGKHLEDSLQNNLKYIGWVKTDLNNDKKEDLIISGYFEYKNQPDREYDVFVFQSDINGQYMLKRLKVSDQENYPIYLSELIFGGSKKKTVLRLIDWAPNVAMNSTLPFTQDSVFSFGKFYINYNSQPLNEWITTVDFRINRDAGLYSKISLSEMDSIAAGEINMSYLINNSWQKIKGIIYPDVYVLLDELVNYCFSPSDLENSLTGNIMDKYYADIKFLNGREVSLSSFAARNRYTFDAICTWMKDLGNYVSFMYFQKKINKSKN